MQTERSMMFIAHYQACCSKRHAHFNSNQITHILLYLLVYLQTLMAVKVDLYMICKCCCGLFRSNICHIGLILRLKSLVALVGWGLLQQVSYLQNSVSIKKVWSYGILIQCIPKYCRFLAIYNTCKVVDVDVVPSCCYF